MHNTLHYYNFTFLQSYYSCFNLANLRLQIILAICLGILLPSTILKGNNPFLIPKNLFIANIICGIEITGKGFTHIV